MKNSETHQKTYELYKALPSTFTFPVGFAIAKKIGFSERNYRAFLELKDLIEPNINKYKKR